MLIASQSIFGLPSLQLHIARVNIIVLVACATDYGVTLDTDSALELLMIIRLLINNHLLTTFEECDK